MIINMDKKISWLPHYLHRQSPLRGGIQCRPLNLGFDRKHYANASGSPIGKRFGGRDPYHVERDGEQVHLSEALTLEAIKEIDQAVKKEKPFFL